MGCRGRGRFPFPCTHTVEALGYFWQWRHLQLPAVKSYQGKMRKVDREPAVVLGQQPHPLAPQNFAQKHVVLLPTKMAMRPHTAYQHGLRIMRFGHARWKLSRRRPIDRRRRLHLQRLVRTHLIIFLAKPVQRLLLLPPVGRRWLGRLLLQRAMHPFMPSVLFRMPGLDPLRHDPNLIHHTASRDNPATACEANGAPLSVRIASGIPNSRKAASKIARTRAVSVFSTAWQRNRYRLCASEMVSGSIRSPSAVWNQPLKSAHHTRLASSACANGSL